MAYKQKYRIGRQITSLDEIAKQEFVYWNNKLTPAGWFMSWQLRVVEHYLAEGCLNYALKENDK